ELFRVGFRGGKSYEAPPALIVLLPQLGSKCFDPTSDLFELGRVVLLIRRAIVPLAVVAATVLRLVRVVRCPSGAKLRDHRIARELGLGRRVSGVVRLALLVVASLVVALLVVALLVWLGVRVAGGRRVGCIAR